MPSSLAELHALLQEATADGSELLGEPPYGVLDLAALRANARTLVGQAKGKPIRIASKSIRCRAVLDELLATPGYAGVLCLTLAEALWLADLGYRDLVVGYPTTDVRSLRRLFADEEHCRVITLMADSPDQLDLIDSVAAPAARPVVRICLELDASLRIGRTHLGSHRSPLFSPGDLQGFARHVQRRAGFTPVGLMIYEAQIAGVYNGGTSPRAFAVRAMQRISSRELRRRRGAAVRAAQDVFEPEFVNGGGTGSIGYTSADPTVTEIAAGSGIFAPGLFSRYRHLRLQPAAFFALPVVRRPNASMATVAGGGWVASGVPAADRLPTIAWPAGLDFVALESAGEAQTPLSGAAAGRLAVGDLVLFRHAKAGELSERVNAFAVVEDGKVADRWLTYRGSGVVLQ
jgi:D-serine deaminase-like pyridoxal phosphate-dependent protein